MVLRSLAVVAIGGALIVGGVATAHDVSFETEIVIDAATGDGNPVTFAGHLESQREACLPGRTVKLIATPPEGRTVVDVDKTSSKGYWAVGGNTGPFTDSVRVTKRNIGPRGHRHICKGDSAGPG